MELKDYIEEGEKKVGGVGKLAEKICTSRTMIPDAKAGRKGLPALACVNLANLIEENVVQVLAASELITERDEKKRAAWLKHASKISKLSSFFMAGACFLLVSGAPNNAEARANPSSVTSEVTKAYGNGPILSKTARTICIMSNLKRTFRRFGSWLSKLATYFQPLSFQG